MTQDGTKAALVVVGVDGSAHADAALRHGMEEAARRGASVQAVIACRPPETWMYSYDLETPPSPEGTRAAARAAVQARIDAVRAEGGPAVADVPVEAVAIFGSPTPVLVDAARDAQLLVVGHRGCGTWRSALLGSVGLGAVLHAPCPVTVVQPAHDSVGAHVAPAGTASMPLPIGPIA